MFLYVWLFINPAKLCRVYRCQSFIPWYHYYCRNNAQKTVSITIYITWYIMWYIMWCITLYISIWYSYTYNCSSTPQNLVLFIVVNHSYHGTMTIADTARKRRSQLLLMVYICFRNPSIYHMIYHMIYHVIYHDIHLHMIQLYLWLFINHAKLGLVYRCQSCIPWILKIQRVTSCVDCC